MEKAKAIEKQNNELRRLKTYVRQVDRVIDPEVSVSRASLGKDGFIPGWVVVKMFRLEVEKGLKARFRDRVNGKVAELIRLGFGPSGQGANIGLNREDAPCLNSTGE